MFRILVFSTNSLAYSTYERILFVVLKERRKREKGKDARNWKIEGEGGKQRRRKFRKEVYRCDASGKLEDRVIDSSEDEL